MDPERLRFRQHLKTEMAHYAADCWDAEALLCFGWTEIVGIADRGCWDLSRHIEFSNAEMNGFKRFDEPVEVEKDVLKAKFGMLGPEFKGKAKAVATALEAADPIQDRGRQRDRPSGRRTDHTRAEVLSRSSG